MAATAPTSVSHATSSGGWLVAVHGRQFALLGAELRVEARAGLARVVLEQRFRNPHAEPLHATYQLPLPPDAAVSGFAFRVGTRRIVGEVDLREAARERFEEALIEGRSAALLDQDRTSLFTQQIGNIPPSAELVAEITLDQRLRWLEAGEWEWRFPTVVAPRYLGAPEDVPDAARVMVPVADPNGGGFAPRASLRLVIGDAIARGGAPESSSHSLAVSTAPGEENVLTLVSLAEETARLDRDVVVRWPVASTRLGVTLVCGRPEPARAHAGSAYGLLTIVPPLPEAQGGRHPRDLIVLLDTSGSMSGKPLEQAKAVVRTLIETLGPADHLDLISFSSSVTRWRRWTTHADERARRDAIAWVSKLEARGGTDMAPGIVAALASARDVAQRQVVLVTDGLIGFEDKVVAEIRNGLPPATRVHTVGVGSAVNRSLTAAAARAGRGAEVLIGLGEDPAAAIAQLLARTCAPLVTQLEVGGTALLDHAPAALPDVFAGSPVRIAVRLRPEGGTVVVRGKRPNGGYGEERVDVPQVAPGTGSAAVVALYARERVEDLDTQAAAGETNGIDSQIERLGLDFQIATRRTSWVAIAEEPTVDPGQPVRRERIPHLLPHGMSAEGLGLREAATSPAMAMPMICLSAPPAASADLMEEDSDAFFEPDALADRGSLRPRAIDRRTAASRPPSFRPAAPAKERPVLAARILLRRGRQLVVEFDLPFPLDWRPGAEVTVVHPNGSITRAYADPERTTHPGLVDAGCTVRLALDLGAEPGAEAPAEIRLESAGIPLRLRIGS